MTKHLLFIPKCPWASMLRVGGGVMWGLCLVINTAGAAAGHASVPPRIFCRCSCQSDQITQKPQSDLKQSKKNVRAWPAVLLVGPKTLNRLQREEQAVLQQTSSVLTPQRHFVREEAGGVRYWRLEKPACVEVTTGSKPSPTLVIFIMEFRKHNIVNSSVNIQKEIYFTKEIVWCFYCECLHKTYKLGSGLHKLKHHPGLSDDVLGLHPKHPSSKILFICPACTFWLLFFFSFLFLGLI